MFRFRSLSIAAAILFLIAGGTAYGGSVKPQPLGVFAPTYSLRAGLEQTIRWFLEPSHQTRYKPDIYNV